MSKTEIESPSKLGPCYGQVEWYKTFFELIRNKQYDKFDKGIIQLNIVGGPNAGMLFNGLRFLGLVQEDGTVTPKFESLRIVGEDFKKNLKKVVEDAYGDLFSKVVVNVAKPENVINYFMQGYGYRQSSAQLATMIFVYLCQESGTELSPELMAFEIKRPAGQEGKGKGRRSPGEGKGPKAPIAEAPEGMHQSTWGNDIILYLRKGDRKTRERIATQAKKLIEMYVEEEEET